MTTDPYDQATDEAFDQIINHARHPGGRTMTREPSTAEDKKAQAWQMAGCASLFLSICAGLSLILAVWKW